MPPTSNPSPTHPCLLLTSLHPKAFLPSTLRSRGVLGAVALDEVEAPGIEAQLQTEPAEPNFDALLHLTVVIRSPRLVL